MLDWQNSVNALRYEAIATVYAYSKGAKLSQPMLALRSDTGEYAQIPAQFVFDRGQLGGEQGLLAFVISASQGDRLDLQNRVIEQGKSQLNLPDLQPIQTIIEKRATFACTPDLKRPSNQIAPGLLVCGDYVAGPYPATLEGAVRSALQCDSPTAQCVLERSTTISPCAALTDVYVEQCVTSHVFQAGARSATNSF